MIQRSLHEAERLLSLEGPLPNVVLERDGAFHATGEARRSCLSRGSNQEDGDYDQSCGCFFHGPFYLGATSEVKP